MRYLLDANVVSEPVKPRPNPSVLERLEESADDSCIAAPVLHELLYGVDRLPDGRKRRRLERYVNTVVRSLPVLPYDLAAASLHARQRAELERRGLTPGFVDGQIAAIALVHGLVLVTRNVDDFAHFPGLRIESWFGR